MLMFEAIDVLKGIRKEVISHVCLFSSQQSPKVRFILQSMLIYLVDLETYRETNVAAGKKLAKAWIQFLEQEGHAFDEIGAIVFNRISCAISQALEGYYLRLLERLLGQTMTRW
jgi:hypothetical protein